MTCTGRYLRSRRGHTQVDRRLHQTCRARPTGTFRPGHGHAAAGEEIAVPAQHRVRPHHQPYSAQRAAGKARSLAWRSARISTSLSRSLIGSRRRRANAFVVPRYAGRSSTAHHHAVPIARCATIPDARLGVVSDTSEYRSASGRMGSSAGAKQPKPTAGWVGGVGVAA
jgi:hypothetical protein